MDKDLLGINMRLLLFFLIIFSACIYAEPSSKIPLNQSPFQLIEMGGELSSAQYDIANELAVDVAGFIERYGEHHKFDLSELIETWVDHPWKNSDDYAFFIHVLTHLNPQKISNPERIISRIKSNQKTYEFIQTPKTWQLPLPPKNFNQATLNNLRASLLGGVYTSNSPFESFIRLLTNWNEKYPNNTDVKVEISKFIKKLTIPPGIPVGMTYITPVSLAILCRSVPTCNLHELLGILNVSRAESLAGPNNIDIGALDVIMNKKFSVASILMDLVTSFHKQMNDEDLLIVLHHINLKSLRIGEEVQGYRGTGDKLDDFLNFTRSDLKKKYYKKYSMYFLSKKIKKTCRALLSRLLK